MNTEKKHFNAVDEELGSKSYAEGRLSTLITTRNSKYGVIRVQNGQVLIPFEYDNIFQYYPYDRELILCRDGKVGAIDLGSTEDNGIRWISPCRYDSCERWGGDLLFWTAEEQRYYFRQTKKVKVFSQLHVYENYLYGIDTNGCSILRRLTGEAVWSMSNEEIAQNLPNDAPCLAYMGESCNLPLFYDVTNAGSIIPRSHIQLEYDIALPDVIKPIIVNGRNILTIVGGPDGINAVEYDGRCFHGNIPCEYEEVTVELRLFLRNGAHTEERIIQIPQGRFTPDSFFDFPDW